MDLLYSNSYDCFCIVSSDSDFQYINIRLRQASFDVYGFGEEKASNCYKNSCTKFITLKPNKIPSKENNAKINKGNAITSNKLVKDVKEHSVFLKKHIKTVQALLTLIGNL